MCVISPVLRYSTRYPELTQAGSETFDLFGTTSVVVDKVALAKLRCQGSALPFISSPPEGAVTGVLRKHPDHVRNIDLSVSGQHRLMS